MLLLRTVHSLITVQPHAPALVTVTDVQAEMHLMLLKQALHTSPVSIHHLVRVSQVTDVQAERPARMQAARAQHTSPQANLLAPALVIAGVQQVAQAVLIKTPVRLTWYPQVLIQRVVTPVILAV